MNPSSWARKGDSQSSTTLTFILVLVLAAVLTGVTLALSGSRHGEPSDDATADGPVAAEATTAAPRRSRKRRVAGWLWKRALSRLS